uniref:Protein kinase domain-containing protein n=1 Tax=Gouania willdenowi TaxID=441366 RepID=A0A8C5I6P7_GOUWI
MAAVLCSSSTEYTIIEFMGEGSFGKVAKCQIKSTCKIVAVKILKDEVVQNVQHEVRNLRHQRI